ncbi:MAG: PsbP-related protein [Candidatus Hydrothermia bacterium]
MKKIIGLATASGVAIALLACGGKSKGIEYSDSSFGITVKLPGGWKQVSKETENDLITVDFEKGDLDVNLMYSEIPGMEESGLTGADFMDMMMEEFAGKDATLETIHEGSTIVAGVKGYEKTFKGVIEGSDGIARTIMLTNNDKMTVIIFVHEGETEFSSADKKGMDEFIKGISF